MAGINLEIADERLTAYMAAETAVLAGQAHEFADGRKLTRADLGEIREGIVFWSGWVDKLNTVQRALPRPAAVGRIRRGGYRMR